ncbi:glycosyltransferase family 2 protein [Nosocomiicoccus ampullae]|uniref:Glycosyltransferase involved in cell wall biosynthesis n=3 Tax=Nosocomiicoccus ampullae TaxID=489910 RepID=A0A9Q2CZM2_9STAP|nr:glycosyltransferase family 2 protein [Nosocomiicoccus ampullae]MBB5175966.1 glycosyltransferase involved in cell wall biosynthesis [Nosocomiicoccus ampullae]QYA46704.1 glycosyltransferase family 2 protein [Nosocomiicoccus ampullae]
MISIIVPTFNGEKTIRKTITNIIESATHLNYELIVVNDGSTDSSLQILNELKTNGNIKVINQDNRGVSSARNTGIQNISKKSKYITFIDDSDLISKNFLSDGIQFLRDYKDVDLAICRIEKLTNNVLEDHNLNFRFNNMSHKVNIINAPEMIHYHMGGVVFRSALFLEEKFRFDEEISFWEDAKLINSILLEKKKYGLLKESVYYYNRDPHNSLTIQSWNDEKRYKYHIEKNYRELVIKSIDLYGKVIDYIQFLIASHYLQFIIKSNSDLINKDYIKQDSDFLYASKQIFNYIDTDVIENLRTSYFYKSILFKLKELEYNTELNKSEIKVYGQKYDFLRQKLYFSFSKEIEKIDSDYQVYKRTKFLTNQVANLINEEYYIEPLFNKKNTINKVFMVHLNIFESLFDQKFIIINSSKNINIEITSKSLVKRTLKRILKR